MADPKIRYDIAATASGAAEVEKLATEFEKLDGAVDPQLAERARAAAQELRNLGEQKAAIDTFRLIKNESFAARENLGQLQEATQRLAREISATAAPTRAQVGQLESLRAALDVAKKGVKDTDAALVSARDGLLEFGIESSNVSEKAVQLKTRIAGVEAEIQQLTATAKGQGGFVKLVQDTDAARVKMQAAATAVAEFQKAIGQAGPATAGEADKLRNLQQAAAIANTQFEALQRSTAESVSVLRQAGFNTENLTAKARELAAAQQAGANAGKANAAAFTQQGQAAQASAAQQLKANESVRGSLQGIGDQLRTLQTVAAAVVGGQLLAGSLGDLARVADGYKNLQARIGLVTGEGQALQQAFDGVFQVAQRTNSSLETTGNLFTRIAAAGKDIGLTTQAALSLTETINQAVQVSGSSAEASDAAITQLIQGLQSGVLRGEEFNSVMEQAPRLAKALADGLGISTGALREQAQAGALSSQVVIAALQGQADTVAREFSKLPPTVGRAITSLSTSWTQYVGEVDAANGISSKAASVIGALANNLDTLAGLLIGAGKAAAAYKAIQLAQTFIANAEATVAATVAAQRQAIAIAQSSVASLANTAATTANTAAKVANAAAGGAAAAAAEGATASTGKFGAALSSIKGFALLAVLLNIKDIGTALGEYTAKLFGAGNAEAQLERQEKARAAAQQEMSRIQAAQNQQMEIAKDKALGLSVASKAVVTQFEDLTKKGDTTAEALDKVSKNLKFSDTKSITDVTTALDVLAQKGAITATQVSDTLSKALSGVNLSAFQTQAQNAFDGSEQGARRLALAIDAIGTEALRRAGVSVVELQTGFSHATSSAISDVDALSQQLVKLGVKGADAGRALSGSLDKALDASNTERAVQAVIERWQDLGRQGLISGDQLAAGLEKARAKIDAIKPGISSMDEALRAFGLKTSDELQRTAANFSSAWDRIKSSTTIGLSEKIKAFEQYREAAEAANGGVISSEIEVQAEMLKIQAAAQTTGLSLADMGDIGAANIGEIVKRAREAKAALDLLNSTPPPAPRPGPGNAPAPSPNAEPPTPPNLFSQAGQAERNANFDKQVAQDREKRLAGQNAVDAGGFFIVQDKLRSGTLTAADAPLVEALQAAVKQNSIVSQGANAGTFSLDGLQSMSAQAAVAQSAGAIVRELVNRQNNPQDNSSGQQRGGATYKVELNLNGRATTIQTANAQSAQALADFMRGLQEAADRAIPRG